MKIALVGEAPNDTAAIKNLLSKQYTDIEFVILIDDIHGSMLDNRKAIRRLLRIEYEDHLPDFIIFIRDLDALENNKKAKRKRQETFSYCNSIVDKKGIKLLHIFELEALILADIEAFNNHYGCSYPKVADPMKIVNPKEELMDEAKRVHRQFNESDTPKIFDMLNFDIVLDNCRYFAAFIKKLDKAISA